MGTEAPFEDRSQAGLGGVHRGTSVNAERVRALCPGIGGDWLLVLARGEELRVGRSYRGAVAARWRAPGGGIEQP